MTEWTGVSYRPAAGFLTCMDPRAKIGCIVMVGLTGVRAEVSGLMMLTAVLTVCLVSAKIGLKNIKNMLRK